MKKISLLLVLVCLFMFSCDDGNSSSGSGSDPVVTAMDDTMWLWSITVMGYTVDTTYVFSTDLKGTLKQTSSDDYSFTYTYDSSTSSGTITYGTAYIAVYPTSASSEDFTINDDFDIMTLGGLIGFDKQ